MLFDLHLNIVFNDGSTSNLGKQKMCNDKKLIEDLGGPAKVAKLLGYDKHGGVQRVQNWTTRGIPPKVRLDHPDLFPMPSPTSKSAASGATN